MHIFAFMNLWFWEKKDSRIFFWAIGVPNFFTNFQKIWKKHHTVELHKKGTILLQAPLMTLFFWHTLCRYLLCLYILKIIFLKVFKLMWRTNSKEYENLKTKVLFYSLKIDVQFEFWKSKLTKSKCKWTYLFKVGGRLEWGRWFRNGE